MPNQLTLFDLVKEHIEPQPQPQPIDRYKVSTYHLKRVRTDDTTLAIHEPVKSPGDVAGSMRHIFKTDEMHKEHFFMVSLDTQNQIIAAAVVHIGTLNAAIVHPRDVFQHALLDNAANIVIGHNHPSGKTRPSDEDIKITERLVEAGNILGIHVLDHIILGEGRGNYLSMKEKGLM